MIAAPTADGLAWLASALAIGALGAASGAAMARSLFVMIAYLAATSAMLAAALLALGQSEAALALGLFGVGLAPVLLLNTLALTTRIAKRRGARASWLLIAGAVIVAGAACWAAPDLGVILVSPAAENLGGWIGAFLAAIMTIAGVFALALLGFGERGALEGAAPRRAGDSTR